MTVAPPIAVGLVVAHAAHWFGAALYLAPVALVVLALVALGRRDSAAEALDNDEDQARPA